MSLYEIVVPTFIQILRGLSAQLQKGDAWAKEAGVSERDFLEARLADDMKPLSEQVRLSCSFARTCLTRLTGKEYPETAIDDPSVDALTALLNSTIEMLEQASKADVDGAADRAIELTIPTGQTFDLNGFEYTRDWSMAHFYFHAVTAYAIMRHLGVDLGKIDFVGHMRAYLRDEPAAKAG